MCEKARSHPESKECTKGANVAARIVSKGKRVSPEEPLTLNLSIAKAKKNRYLLGKKLLLYQAY